MAGIGWYLLEDRHTHIFVDCGGKKEQCVACGEVKQGTNNSVQRNFNAFDAACDLLINQWQQ